MEHPFKYFTRVFGKGLVDSQRKIIQTVNSQITGHDAVMNCDTLLKDEQRKEEDTTVSPHCKLKAAWMQYFLFLLSNEELEFLHPLDLSEDQNKIQAPELSAFPHLHAFFQVSCYITAL